MAQACLSSLRPKDQGGFWDNLPQETRVAAEVRSSSADGGIRSQIPRQDCASAGMGRGQCKAGPKKSGAWPVRGVASAERGL